MPRQGLWRPLLTLFAGLALIVTMLIRTEHSASTGRFEEFPDQDMTAYALSQGNYPSPTQRTPTVSSSATTPTTTSATLTATLTPLPPSPTRSPTTVVQPATAATTPPTATPTQTDAQTCVPGTITLIEGSGPPRAPILLFFGTRIVGGGSTSAAGTFAIPLTLGEERPGQYTVTVRIRGTDTVLREIFCSVPPVTPTPFPTRSAP